MAVRLCPFGYFQTLHNSPLFEPSEYCEIPGISICNPFQSASRWFHYGNVAEFRVLSRFETVFRVCGIRGRLTDRNAGKAGLR